MVEVAVRNVTDLAAMSPFQLHLATIKAKFSE